MLGVEPLELCFQFQLNTVIKRSVVLTNDRRLLRLQNHDVELSPILHTTKKNIVPPHSKCGVTVTLQALEIAIPLKCKYGASQFIVRFPYSVTNITNQSKHYCYFTNKMIEVKLQVGLSKVTYLVSSQRGKNFEQP
jgi:hypothetical protein